MLFKVLFQYTSKDLPKFLENQRVKNLQISSQEIQAGDLFIALQGATIDSHCFIKEVLDKGAFVVKNSDFPYLPSKDELHRIINVPDTRKIVAPLSKAFFKNPDDQMLLIGITGTNGKTTSSLMLEHFLKTVKKWKMGLIGTLHNRIGDRVIPTKNTTPDAFSLFSLLSEMREAKCQAVIMEISSHALALHRVDFLSLNVGIFTNLTEDHLDFHKTMEHYAESKLHLFDLLRRSPKKEKFAIFPKDLEISERILERLALPPSIPYQTYEIVDSAPQTNIQENKISAIIDNYDIKHTEGSLYEANLELGKFSIPFPGSFNVRNFLGSFLCAKHFQLPLNECLQSLKTLDIPGRFNNIAPPSYPFSIIVDYAHTPDAMENVLRTTRSLKPHRILLVFGCGGDRDRTKRPLMGKIATQWADKIFVTSDNPRTEDPLKILDEVIQGMDDNSLVEKIASRKTAILKGIDELESGDIMIIAGKGHEQYQIFKFQTISFSDQKVVLDALSAKGSFPWK